MFEEDVKRINSCIQHDDYYSAMEFAILIKNNYKNKERNYLENIILNIKSGNYEKIDILFKTE